MNILIESGATKSTCIGFSGACTFFTYKTTGINATYASKDTIIAVFEEIVEQNKIVTDQVENIRFYGAGCFIPVNAEKVKDALHVLFPKANIDVFTDLLAACHVLCNNNKGFVGILGTGSASCFYDGNDINDKAPSLGYMIGDEGSGTYIGKLFVKEYLTGKIETDVLKSFEKTFSVSQAIVINKIYQEPKPQTFFASIPIFLQKHIENRHIKKLIANSFQDFFDQQTDYYGNFSYPWFFCGSIAFHFQDILIETAHKNSLNIEKIIKEAAPLLIKS